MEPREYAKEDYETLREWWRGHHDSPFVPIDKLTGKGLIVDDVAFFMMYKSDDMYLLEWPISKPDINQIDIYKAFMVIVEMFQGLISDDSMILAYPCGSGMRSLLEKKGFLMANEYNKEMVWSCNVGKL